MTISHTHAESVLHDKGVQYISPKVKYIMQLFAVPFLLLPWACRLLIIRIKNRLYPPDSDDEGEEDADAWGTSGKDGLPPADPYIGAEVVLRNLTKLEYNGLKGKLIKYLDDKERWQVDVIIHMTQEKEEHKELSLKVGERGKRGAQGTVAEGRGTTGGVGGGGGGGGRLFF